jgi:hypothetical protein
MIVTLAVALAALTPTANAGKCDALIKKADTAPVADLPKAFEAAAACSAEEASAAFPRFLSRATDSEVLVQLSLVAINRDIWNPVWTMLGRISDYSTRDIISGQVGEACTTNPKVVTFLQGAYVGLRGLDFQQWDDAFQTCQAPELRAWMDQQISNPPTGSYDEKYEQLLGIYINVKRAEALPGLKTAALAALSDGPFDAILLKMEEAVAPRLGAEISAENKAAIEAALVEIATSASPERARAVAERLVATGADASAASLLPVVFPDRVKGGTFTWGGMAIERGECKGVKTAILHTAVISEPGKRWIVTDEAVPAMGNYKGRLKKCTMEEGAWPVVISAEPLVPGSIDAWARSVGGEWAAQGYTVEIHPEAPISLD